jgi:hypothetical protein
VNGYLPVTVTNGSSTSALSYYQVPVALSGSAYTSITTHGQTNLVDIVVTDSDGVTTLPFALEEIDTTNSVVYLLVKLSLAANTNKTIFVYYGNAAATSTSSYTNTVQPVNAISSNVDIWNQSNAANYNANPILVLLQNQGGAGGGDSPGSGQGAGSGAGTGSSMDLTRSTTGGMGLPRVIYVAPRRTSRISARGTLLGLLRTAQPGTAQPSTHRQSRPHHFSHGSIRRSWLRRKSACDTLAGFVRGIARDNWATVIGRPALRRTASTASSRSGSAGETARMVSSGMGHLTFGRGRRQLAPLDAHRRLQELDQRGIRRRMDAKTVEGPERGHVESHVCLACAVVRIRDANQLGLHSIQLPLQPLDL